ncbi:MAG: GH3 auxin-responsive promoter family protein, partial [Muricauda sp.]|nr:GH3 auxin-responsive promoter family protein [Allomuricauda sp.]
MSLKAFAARIFAKRVAQKTKKWVAAPIETQEKVFNGLIFNGKTTQFGNNHDFENIRSHADFVERVPVRDYEELKGYVQQIIAGKKDVLWPGKPIYFAKTSGTTSGAKY